jgi:hypothetical protein
VDKSNDVTRTVALSIMEDCLTDISGVSFVLYIFPDECFFKVGRVQVGYPAEKLCGVIIN